MYSMYYDDFHKPSHRKCIFGLQGRLHGIRVKFVYEGHRTKVKVTSAKEREISYFRKVKFQWTITPFCRLLHRCKPLSKYFVARP